MNILITGGAGFIGSHLADNLISQIHQVTIIDNLSSGNIKNLNPKAQFIEMDINDDLTDLFQKNYFDCVIHLAAQINLRQSIVDPYQDAKINILGSLNLLEQVRKNGIKKFIFASTGGAIYSPFDELPWEEYSSILPQSPYGMAKYTVENYLQLYKKLYNLDYTILRLANVYGPRQNALGEAGVISIFIDKILHDQDLTIFGDGEQSRDFIFVKDVVSAFATVINKNLSGIYNVGTNTECKINCLVEVLENLITKKLYIVKLEKITGELFRSRLNYDKLKHFSKWEPKYNITDGIAETIKYCQTINLNA